MTFSGGGFKNAYCLGVGLALEILQTQWQRGYVRRWSGASAGVSVTANSIGASSAFARRVFSGCWFAQEPCAHNVFFHCLLRRSCGLWRGDVQSMMALGAYRSQHSLVLAWSFAVQETLAEYKLVHPYAMWAHFWCVVLQLSW